MSLSTKQVQHALEDRLVPSSARHSFLGHFFALRRSSDGLTYVVVHGPIPWRQVIRERRESSSKRPTSDLALLIRDCL